MRRTFIPAAAAALLLLTACGAENGDQAGAGQETSKAPKGPQKVTIGDTVRTEHGGSITVYEYRVTTDALGEKVGAADVEVCVASEPPSGVDDTEIAVVTDYWSAIDTKNRHYNWPGEWTDNKNVAPVLESENPTSWGECVRGWTLLETDDKTEVTAIRYYRPKNDQSGTADIRWALKSEQEEQL